MKYIKKFEIIDYSKDKYWKLNSLSPYYEISLKKIGMNEEEEQEFMSNRGFWEDKQDYIYIMIQFGTPIAKIIGHEYSWVKDDAFLSHIRYMGEVIVTPEEIEQYKMQSDAKDFNL